MKRTASAHWEGNIKEGRGILNTESGTLSNVPYSFARRFGSEKGTNPEELIGAAHAGCFAMAFSGELEKRQLTPESIDVRALVSLEKSGDGFAIPAIQLSVTVSASGSDRSGIEEAARSAKENCPVSKLMNADISMDLNISSQESASLQ